MGIRSFTLTRMIIFILAILGETVCVALFFVYEIPYFSYNLILLLIGFFGTTAKSIIVQHILLFVLVLFFSIIFLSQILCCFKNHKFVVIPNIIFTIEIIMSLTVFITMPEVVTVILLDIFFLVLLNVAAYLTKKNKRQGTVSVKH